MITLNLPMADYLGLQAVSASDLITIDKTCPQVAWASCAMNPKRIPSEDTEATIIGTALHTLVLEPEEFPRRYAVRPADIDLRTKEGKAWAAENGNRIRLSADNASLLADMRDAIYDHQQAKRALNLGGVSEAVINWIDAETGLLCKCRPDRLIERHGMIIDLKTTVDASPSAFSRQAGTLGYYMRAAWGIEAMRATGISHAGTYSFIVVEKTAPYPVVVATYNQTALEWARIQIRAAMLKFAACLKAGEWPGYSDDRVLELGLPAWAEKTLQDRHERGEFSTEGGNNG